MTGVFRRRIGTAAAATTVLALMLAGCAAPSQPSSGASPTGGTTPTSAAEPVTLTLGWWGGDARADLTQKAIAAFEAKYPNIKVEPQYTDWNGYWDQLATLTAAGDAPDVMQMDELYLASYGARGALADLAGSAIDTTNIAPEALGTGQVGGVQYAMPIGVTTYAVVANADLFAKYGVELPDDETWTWDDFAAIANELSTKSNGEIYGTTQIGGFDVGNVKHWARSVGNEIFDAEGNVTLDPQVLVDVWDYQLALQASGGMQPPAAIVESFNAGISAGAMATQAVALGTQWNTQITALATASGADIRLLKPPAPAGTKPASLKPSMYWALSSKSEHPAEAAQLVDFLINDPAAAEILLTERGIPVNSVIRDQITPKLAETDQRAVEYLNRVQSGPAPVVTPNGASGIEGILQRYTQEVFAGQSEPRAAAEAFIAELQGEIDAAK